MPRPVHIMILDAYLDLHNRILAFTEKLSEEQLTRKVTPNALPIAFFLWHLGRWADHIQASMPGMTAELSQRLPPGRQIWEEQGLSDDWGFKPHLTGYAQTGMDMDEAAASKLQFPPKDILLTYIRQAFAAAEKAIQAIDESEFSVLEQPQSITEGVYNAGETVGNAVFDHFPRHVTFWNDTESGRTTKGYRRDHITTWIPVLIHPQKIN